MTEGIVDCPELVIGLLIKKIMGSPTGRGRGEGLQPTVDVDILHHLFWAAVGVLGRDLVLDPEPSLGARSRQVPILLVRLIPERLVGLD